MEREEENYEGKIITGGGEGGNQGLVGDIKEEKGRDGRRYTDEEGEREGWKEIYR